MEMAREAGWDAHHAEFDTRIEAFAKLVREDEREACAKIADTEASKWGGFDSGFEASIDIADAIRARGEQT
jgi:hypothetical protein